MKRSENTRHRADLPLDRSTRALLD